MATTTTFLLLTTTFTGAPECSSLFVAPEGSRLYAFDPGYPLKDPTAPKCAPDQALTWWQQQNGVPTWTDIGGPTFICPAQFTTAATIQQGSRILIGCCPKSYDFINWFNPGAPGECSSVFKPGSVTFISPGSNGVFSKTSSLVTSTTAIYGVQINGYITPGTASLTTSASTTPSSTTSSNTSSTTATTSALPPASKPAGLSTGAQAGIGIGAGAIAILALVGAFLWYRRRHRYSAVELAATGGNTPNGGTGSPNGYYEQPKQGATAQEVASANERAGYWAPAMVKEDKPQELSSANRPIELP